MNRNIGIDVIRTAGLMTGTSMDGLDICIADIQLTPDSLNYQVIAAGFVPFPAELRQRIVESLNTSTEIICALHYDLGRFYAASLQKFLTEKHIEGLELIGTHGQTIHHISGHSTLQIGEPSFLAEQCGVPVISDFRARDIAAGGTGAPLIPVIDEWLFGHQETGRVLLNIGGVANVTLLPPRDSHLPLLGFDTGPGMGLLDEYFQQNVHQNYDEDGRLAAQGKADLLLLQRWLQHEFIVSAPPKSTGRDIFGRHWLRQHKEELDVLELADRFATLAALTAHSIAANIRPFLGQYAIKSLYVSGGGTRHPVIMAQLKKQLPELIIANTSSLGVDTDSKEALGFAVLATAFIKKIPGNKPSVTGAEHSVVLGKLTV